MPDETALKIYESARDRLRELLRQEIEIKNQISHCGADCRTIGPPDR